MMIRLLSSSLANRRAMSDIPVSTIDVHKSSLIYKALQGLTAPYVQELSRQCFVSVTHNAQLLVVYSRRRRGRGQRHSNVGGHM